MSHLEDGCHWPVAPACTGDLSSSISMTVFPVELYGLIADHVSSRGDLFNLACLSSAIRIEAESALYRSVPITGATRYIDPLLDIVSTTPRLSLSVQELDIQFNGRFPASISKLANTFRALNNLIDLRLYVADLVVHELTHGCSFKLRRFFYKSNSTIIPESLGDFLLRQPLIHVLSLPMYDDDNPLPMDALPNLDTLECSGYLTTALNTPNRPIRRLKWAPGIKFLRSHTPDPFFPLLLLVTSHSPIDGNIPTQCPNLKILECSLESLVPVS